MQVAYEYIRVKYEYIQVTYEWHTNDIRITYEWHTLVDLSVLKTGTDDGKAIYNGVLGELLTRYILGFKHVKKNVSDKLKEFQFPNAPAKIIMNDIFISLYNCETNDYDELVPVLNTVRYWNQPLKVKDKENLWNA